MLRFAHFFPSLHPRRQGEASAKETRGRVITWWGWSYDLMQWFANLVFRGKWQALRQMTADLAQLQPGETVLDVGCGTGTLAMEAYERVGATGRVSGIDPSVQLIARARHKAERAGLSIDFQLSVIEQLAFPDQSFDVVLIPTCVPSGIIKETLKEGKKTCFGKQSHTSRSSCFSGGSQTSHETGSTLVGSRALGGHLSRLDCS